MTLFSDAHKTRLDKARQVIKSRENWAAFAEVPSEKIYGEGSKARGEEAFHALLGKPFALPWHRMAPNMSRASTPLPTVLP